MATFPIALSQAHSDNVGMHDPCLPARGCPRNKFYLSSQGLHSTVGYSLCSVVRRATAERSQGREFLPAHGLDCLGMHGGSFPNGLLQFLLAAADGRFPLSNRQLPQRTRRKGEGAEDDEAGTTAFPFLLEAGQAEVGPCFSFSCAHVPMCPFSYPLPLASRSRSVPEFLLATVHNATKCWTQGHY